MRIVVLPGMDGGASLSASFRLRLEGAHDAVAVEYPPDEPWGYSEVEAHVRARLESREPTLLVAESFSGPVAISLAAEPPDSLVGVLLVATFARPPVWSGFRHAALPALFRVDAPGFAVRRFMLEGAANDVEVRAVKHAIRRSEPSVMSARLRAMLTVDVREALRARKVPTLAVRALRDRMLAAARSVTRDDPTLPAHAIDGPHLLLNARPVEMAKVVERFIEDASSTTS